MPTSVTTPAARHVEGLDHRVGDADDLEAEVGAAPVGELRDVQAAFRDCHGLQCGFCTPGFVVTVTAFRRDHPDPTADEIREALGGNLCRCTGYQGILRAVRQAAGRAPVPTE